MTAFAWCADVEQFVQVVEDQDSSWIGDPALRLDKIDPLINRASQNIRRFIGQVTWFEHRAAVPKIPVRLACASRCPSSIPNRSHPRLFLTLAEFGAQQPSWRLHRRH